MIDSPKISIIIPVYNAEKQLKKCLESLIDQSFQDFELLLINDGSTDATGEICANHANKYNNIRVFHQHNAGPSAARNKGIKKAKGTFITFVDADDYIGKGYLEGFFVTEKNPKKSLVQLSYIREYSDGKREEFKLPSKIYHQNDFSDLFYSIRLIRWWPFTWGKLYDAEVLKKRSILFDEDIHFGEDLIFLLEYLHYADTVILSGYSYYHYLYNEESLTRSLYGFHSEIKRFYKVKKLERTLSKKYEFSVELRKMHHKHFSNYFYRALHSLYIPPHKKEKKNRVQTLKTLHENKSIDYIKSGPWSKAKVYKVALRLIKAKQYKLADALLRIWYKYKFPEFK